MASRSVFSGREIASPSGPTCTCAPKAVPPSRLRARSGSEHSTCTSKEDPASSWAIGPWRITVPRSTMATASQVRSTSSRRCDDSTTVRPSDTSDVIMSRMSSMPAGSRPFMGSSRMSSWGSPSRQAATPSRWRMPMEYFDTLSSARCRMPTRSRAGAMRPLAAGSRAAARICRFWRPVRWPWKRGSSTIAPTRARATITVSRDGVAEKEHCAGIGVGQAQQHSDQRGLAGTIRPEVAEGAAAGNEELDVVDGDVLAESLGQPVGLDRPLAVRRSLRPLRSKAVPYSYDCPAQPRRVHSCTCHCARTLSIAGPPDTLLVQWCRHPVRQW